MVTQNARSKKSAAIYAGSPLRRLAGVCLLFCALWFLGCESDSKDDAAAHLVGVWSGNSDGYVISDKWVIYNGYVDSAHPEWSDYSFIGEIKNNPDFTKDSGVIIIKYTKKPIYGTYNEDWTQLTGGAAPAGDYFAIYWRALSSSSVQLANAYDASATETEQSTLQEAQSKFTLQKVGDFVSQWATCTKQR